MNVNRPENEQYFASQANGYDDPASQTGAKRKKWRVGITQFIICLLVVGLLSGSFGALISNYNNNGSEVPIEVQGDIPNGTAISGQNLSASPAVSYDGKASSGLLISETSTANVNPTTEMLQRCMSSIVGVTIQKNVSYYGQISTQDVGSGSGIILTEDGYILTNYHVIDGADAIFVCLQDGSEDAASIVGMDEQTDIAVLKIDAAGLTPVTIGSSSNVLVGETVYAIGNPLGEFLCSVTSGIISGLNRTVQIDNVTMSLIQTDAAVNPGNSGGGLFNSNGELIGIVNAKTSSLDVEGIGFAIPVDSVEGVIADLMDLGYVTGRPYLGVSFQDVYTRSNNNYGGRFGSYYDYTTRVQIVSVEEGGPADKGGIKANDIIIAFDGIEISNTAELTSLLYAYEIGDVVTIRVLRDTEYLDLHVTLGERTQ